MVGHGDPEFFLIYGFAKFWEYFQYIVQIHFEKKHSVDFCT